MTLWTAQLGRRTQHQLLVVFLFFALQIIAPSAVTVRSVDSTIPVAVRVTQRPEVTDADFSFFQDACLNSLCFVLTPLPNAAADVNSFVGVPPGVEGGRANYCYTK